MDLYYFAWVRERIGFDHEAVVPPSEVRTISALADWLCAKGDNYAFALKNRSAIRVARNQTFVSWDEAINEGDEVAFFPPVTGG
jgi:molybdopterin converting factor subunit 1